MIKDYIEYIKDNPKGYWFKSKWFGWGWTPAKWQGWVVTITYLVFVIWVSTLSEKMNETLFLIIVFLASITLIMIAFLKGDRPKWRWGRPNRK
ncbi:hypothetical protein ACFL0C_01280 [Patescibacteria group bacterium]